MRSDDHIGSGAVYAAAGVALRLFGQHPVFHSPVDANGHEFDSPAARAGYVGFDEADVDRVNCHGGSVTDAVGAVGVVEKSDAESVDVGYMQRQRVADGGGAVGADMRHREGVEHGYGALQSAVAPVEAVVVGGEC